MVSRATTFRIGGVLSIALGAGLAAALLWAGAGVGSPDSWTAVALALVLGAFFLGVARDLARFQRQYRSALERGEEPPPGGPPV